MHAWVERQGVTAPEADPQFLSLDVEEEAQIARQQVRDERLKHAAERDAHAIRIPYLSAKGPHRWPSRTATTLEFRRMPISRVNPTLAEWSVFRFTPINGVVDHIRML